MPSGTSARFSLLLTLGLRVFYSVLGVAFAPFLTLDPASVRSNFLDTGVIERSAGLKFLLLGVWQRFDTIWYIHIARSGYDLAPSVVFYPLYPLLIRILTPLVREPLVAALAVSTAAAFFFFWGLETLLRADLKGDLPRRAVLVAAVWPAAFTLFAGYAEGLLAALIVWSIWFARQDRWRLAGVAGFAAGLTKAAGAVLLVPFLVLAWRKPWRVKAAACLPLAAPAVFTVWLESTGRTTGGDVYVRYWHTATEFPVFTFLEALAGAFAGHPVVLLNLPVLLLVLFLVLRKRIRLEYTLYSVAVLSLFLTKRTVPLLQSTLRYLLVVFPAYPAVAAYLRGRAVFAGLLALSLAANIALLYLFFDWWIVV